ILLQLYNLPPEVRTHIGRLMCVGVIPGPRAPKDLASFLLPLDDECAKLAHGVSTYDCSEDCLFDLHAYNLYPLGDIIAIEKFLNTKGHNSFHPCRSCKIRAVNDPNGKKTYYVPLTRQGETLIPSEILL
ncbi:hypothetical protein HYPSUDRAFT_151081, partial [Hypholoma sublateritium FD-334 SS-4]